MSCAAWMHARSIGVTTSFDLAWFSMPSRRNRCAVRRGRGREHLEKRYLRKSAPALRKVTVYSVIAHHQADPGHRDLRVVQVDVLSDQPARTFAPCIDEAPALTGVPIE